MQFRLGLESGCGRVAGGPCKAPALHCNGITGGRCSVSESSFDIIILLLRQLYFMVSVIKFNMKLFPMLNRHCVAFNHITCKNSY